MIVKMKKVFIVTTASLSDAALDALGELGVIHVEPVDPAASPPEQIQSRHSRIHQAIQIISTVEPSDEPISGDIDPESAANEILEIFHRLRENRNRLAELHRQAEKLTLWGNLRREQLDALSAAGLTVRFYAIRPEGISSISAQCVVQLATLSDKRVMVGVAQRQGEPTVPDEAEELIPPERDLPSIRQEAQQVDQSITRDSNRLRELAHLTEALNRRERELALELEFARVYASALKAETLFAVQGWAPADVVDTLAAELSARGIPAAVDWRDPLPEEEPPTLIRYPRWARPIKGLFDILETLPGYREFDVSGFFMIALPIFTGMLIGDAGYGLLFVLIATIFRRRLIAKLGSEKVNLLLIFGLTTLIWGVLSANYFGIGPDNIASVGGFTQVKGGKVIPDFTAMQKGTTGWAIIGKAMMTVGLVWNPNPEIARELFIKISLIVGAAHLAIAHLRYALTLAPNIRALSQLGWTIFELGMLGIIWQVLFTGINKPWHPAILPAVAAGFLMAVLFSHPSKNPIKMLGVGLASSIMPAISAFSDTMSYVRLMAVGIATYYIATAFNLLSWQLAQAASWIAAVPVLLFGHGLNIALALLAVLVHGVRLNMLEFSSNAGVQWSGYPYEPFSKMRFQER